MSLRDDTDSLLLVQRVVDEDEFIETLERRIAILKANLVSLDPLSRWPREPRLSLAAFIGPMALVALSVILAYMQSVAVFVTGLIAVVMSVRTLATHNELTSVYRRDAAVTNQNMPIIEELMIKLERYVALRALATQPQVKGAIE